MIDKTKRKQTLRGPNGIRVILDASEIYRDDPGQGTPMIVECGRGSGTFTAAHNEGELICGDEEVTLTPEQMAWLDSLVDEVWEWQAFHFDAIAA